MFFISPRSPYPLIALVASLCIGCSNKPDWHAKTNPVTGSLTINGSPPLNALLVLQTLDEFLMDSRGNP